MNIPLFKVYMSKKVDDPLLKTIHSGWIGQGEKVKEFEQALQDRIKNPYCLTLASGTHGLHLALRLAGVGFGDEVITSPLTCTATNWPILMQGAVPIWADVKDDMNIDPNSIRKLVTDRTKAIMTIHWGGYPCDMREIKDISVDYQVPIIEDAAHAFGSRYRHTNIGSCSYSDFTMFSFQAIKSLTSVDGGALFCNKGDDYKRGKLLRWYGIDRESPRTDFRCEEDILEWGYKYHMNDINASIGLVNLEEVDWVIDTARKNAAYYDEALKNIDGIRIVQSDPEKISSYWLYTILVENRAEFMYLLGSHGIGVSRVHERNDKHTCTKQFKRDLANLEEVIKKHISIPVGWWVTEEDREYIISTIKKGW